MEQVGPTALLRFLHMCAFETGSGCDMHLDSSEQVSLVASGISTGPEVFNEIMKDHDRNSALIETQPPVEDGRLPFKTQCVRAVGVAIVLKGSMHPAMELLLRHTVQ
jgi:hypothetical protein